MVFGDRMGVEDTCFGLATKKICDYGRQSCTCAMTQILLYVLKIREFKIFGTKVS